MIKGKIKSPCQNTNTFYIWVGGSCDYNNKQRCGGGAYIMEYNHEIIKTYVISDKHTTEFRMMLTVMLHALDSLACNSSVTFLTNAAYLQNFDNPPTEKSANADLIQKCIEAKKRHAEVKLKLIPYHKFPKMEETHDMARQAMVRLRSTL